MFPMKVNRDYLWDYDFTPEDVETEEFRQWYIARVLVRGTLKDLEEIGFGTIYTHLPALQLPWQIREFWDWYFAHPDVKARYEHLERRPATAPRHHLKSPFITR